MPPVHSSQCNFPTFQNEFESNRCAHHATREGSTSSASRHCSLLFRLYLGYPMSTTIITAKRIIWGKLYSASLSHSSSDSFSSVSKSLSSCSLIPPARLLLEHAGISWKQLHCTWHFSETLQIFNPFTCSDLSFKYCGDIQPLLHVRINVSGCFWNGLKTQQSSWAGHEKKMHPTFMEPPYIS